MADNNWLQGRHALITGGGTGIGAAAAGHLHAAGAKITVTGRRLEPLQETAKRIGGYAVSCDVTEPDQIAKAFEEARTVNGPIEMLVVNAGIAESAPFHKMTRDSWDRIIGTNLTAAFECAQAAIAFGSTSRPLAFMLVIAERDSSSLRPVSFCTRAID